MTNNTTGPGPQYIAARTLEYLGITAIRPGVLAKILGTSPQAAGSILNKLGWECYKEKHYVSGNTLYKRNGAPCKVLTNGLSRGWKKRAMRQVFGGSAPDV